MQHTFKPWFSLLLLTVGGMVYLMFRPRTLVLFVVAGALGLDGWVDGVRECVGGVALPEFVVYCLPNGLWALAYVIVIDWVMQSYSRGTRLLCASIIPVLGAVSELMQLCGWLPGTFDVGDVVCYLLPLLLYATWLVLAKSNPKPTLQSTNQP